MVFDYRISLGKVSVSGVAFRIAANFRFVGVIGPNIWIVNLFGTNVIAAYSVVMRIDSLASMPAMNFAAALSTFVGQNLGAGKPERVKAGLIATLGLTSIISISITLIAIFFGKYLMGIFTNDPDVIEIGVKYLVIVSSFYIFQLYLF
ncbi:MAG: MATE family efflux transporter [Bacteroidales bacterium]